MTRQFNDSAPVWMIKYQSPIGVQTCSEEDYKIFGN